MSTPLQPVITKAGLAAIFTADKTGISARLGSVVLGTSGYAPSANQKSLVSQVAEYPIIGGERLSDTLLHIVALADGPKAFWVREIGFKLSDGTLLAVWSHPTEALTYKAVNASLLLAYDLSLAALPANSVTIISNEAGLSLSLAEPLAAQAQALIAEQLRGLRQQDQLDLQAEKQRIAGDQIVRLLSRMQVAEQRQDADRAGQTSVALSLASAVAGDRLRGMRQQDQLDALAEASRRSGSAIAHLSSRVQATEKRQEDDRNGLLSVAISNAAAVIALQLQISKATYGV